MQAPTIRYHKGTFYIICTNQERPLEGDGDFVADNFYVTTNDIWSGEWSDLVHFDWHGIDPSLFFDDDDRVYIQGQWIIGDRTKQPTGTIRQAELDIRTGKLVTEPKIIWGGHAEWDTEGPHTYKKDGSYYLLVSEGGTFKHHMLSIGRSKNIWGPYETFEQNPILTADGKDEYIQHTGHGDLFQDADGLWWVVLLGIRNGQGGRCPMSRESFLTAVEWPEGGWPKIQQPKISAMREAGVLSLPSYRDEEESSSVGFVYIRDPTTENYSISNNGREIKLLASQTDFSANFGTVSFLGKRQRSIDCSVSTTLVHPQSEGKPINAGLALYKDKFRYAYIHHSSTTNKIRLTWYNWKCSKLIDEVPQDAQDGDLELRIWGTEFKYSFFFKQVGTEWKLLGEIDMLDITGPDFTGPIFGLFAFGEAGAEAEFKDSIL